MVITLTGFMGCGKTTVGRILANLLGWEFADLDSYIAHKKGMTAGEFIEKEGELAFRMVEGDCLRDLVVMSEIRDRNIVIALGGGTIGTVALRPLLLNRTSLVYLRASEGLLAERLCGDREDRPLLKKRGIPELLTERRPLYELAPHIVDADGKTPEEISEEIAKTINTHKL